MKKLMFVACAFAGAMGFADASADAIAAEEDIELYKPGSQQGEVVYMNCNSRIPDAWIRFSMAYFAKETNFKISLKDGAFDLAKPEVSGNATLFIVNDPALPPLLVAPESRWTMVNAAPLKCADNARFEARVKKELSRAFAFLCGGGESDFNNTLMSVVRTEQLDKQEDHVLPVDVIDRFRGMMNAVGVTPAIYGDYLSACQEGWATAPTNDAQKAIWEKVHAIPKNPMKIKFDPKKGR